MRQNIYAFEQLTEFDNHHLIVFFYEKRSGLKGFIAIHRNGSSLPAFGATRYWYYKNELEALRDTLRLSQLMSYKSALAGLPYGGAKAAIIHPLWNKTDKKDLLKAYVKKVDNLSGRFITGADVGINESDVRYMKSLSGNIVGVRNDPVKYTALGVYYGMQAAMKHLYGGESLKGRTFAIQGLGKTGHSILDLIYKESKTIYVSDINESLVQEIKRKYPRVIPVDPLLIHKQQVDIFAPCALSNAVNLKNISSLQCKAVAGSANLQLENKQIGKLLHKLDILFAPDFVINAGGLITVADEYEHKRNNEERILRKVKNIKNTLEHIFTESKKQNKATNLIAVEMAEKIIQNKNG